MPIPNGPYLLEGMLAGRTIRSVAIVIFARLIARTADRWVALGRPLNGDRPEFDEADVIRRAAPWILKMQAKEKAEQARWKRVARRLRRTTRKR